MDDKIKQLITEINDRAIREERVRNRVAGAVCLILLILYVLSIGPLAWTTQGGAVSREAELLLMLGLFVFGIVAGLVSRWGPLSGWAALAFPTVLPPLGIGLTMLFCWGHPLTSLGPSILFFSAPFSVGYAFHAHRRAQPKAAARAGLVLAILELAALATLFSVSAYYALCGA